MVFGFSEENFGKKTKSAGIGKMDVNRRIKHANTKNCFSSTPKFRSDCMNGKWMLLSQAKKVIESGFIKTRLDRDELAQSFHMGREQVDETLNTYYEMVSRGSNPGEGSFGNIDEIFSCLVTDDDLVDYHWNVMDDFFESGKQQYYAMEVMEATHLERKECFYFCLMMTKLAGGDCHLDNDTIWISSGYVGERYVQTVYDVSWFLAGKILETLDENVTLLEFFGEREDWYKYNKYPMVPAYITKVMETRRRMSGGVTTVDDMGDVFDLKAIERTLLQWAAKIKEEYGRYAEII